jgi:hypothetical protein
MSFWSCYNHSVLLAWLRSSLISFYIFSCYGYIANLVCYMPILYSPSKLSSILSLILLILSLSIATKLLWGLSLYSSNSSSFIWCFLDLNLHMIHRTSVSRVTARDIEAMMRMVVMSSSATWVDVVFTYPLRK